MTTKNLFESHKRESLQKLENLSPEKYGKNAFQENFYTPSRLFENILYKDVTTLKKIEVNLTKIRELQGKNSFLAEKLHQTKTEKDGIEDTLNQQIKMYKQIIADQETVNQFRLTEIQKQFTLEINTIIQEKEQEIKYFQSQKETLENEIQLLSERLAELEEQINTKDSHFSGAKNEIEKLQQTVKNAQERYRSLQSQKIEQSSRNKQSYEQLSKKYANAELNWKAQLQNASTQKEKERMNAERILRTEFEKAQSQRATQNMQKSQQMREMVAAFKAETERLNNTIAMKDRLLESLNQEGTKEKQHIIQLTKHYESELATAVNQKEYLSKQIQSLEQEMIKNQASLKAEIQDMEACIFKLKEELKLNQINYVNERDRFHLHYGDFQQEMCRLKNDNAKINEIIRENDILMGQIKQLRDLLLESSYQIQKSKEEIYKLNHQNNQLLLKINKYTAEADSLYREKDLLYADHLYRASNRRNDIFRY